MADPSAMQRKVLTTTILLTVAGTISACNGTGASYDHGPWGTARGRTTYPEYSAPWSRQAVGPAYYAVAEPATVATRIPELDVVRPARSQDVQLEIDMDPPASAPVVGTLEPSGSPVPVEPAPSSSAPVSTGQSSAGSTSSPPGVFAAPQRASSYAGAWKASVDASTCKVQLSSVPSLDLYRASTQGCAHEGMRSVNGWSFRDNQVILFSRGQPVARLAGAEAALAGHLNGTGSEIRMTR